MGPHHSGLQEPFAMKSVLLTVFAPTKTRFPFAPVLLVSLLFALPARVENNSNYVFNGTTTNFGAFFILPVTSPGTNNSLQILNGGAVTNDTGQIGQLASDPFNYVLVSGTNSSGTPSTWKNNTEFYIGNLGSFNQLIVTNGGLV